MVFVSVLDYAGAMANTATVGVLLRQWREHRRLSQLDLANNAEISARHLSFLETGRSNPSRDMIVRLSQELQIPLRQRNTLLNAGGYAEMYPERRLGDPALNVVGNIVDIVLSGHEPNPAMAIDHRWNILATNRMIDILLRTADPSLRQPPMNAMRLGLHPAGLAPHIRNFAEWRTHAIVSLKRRIELTADRELVQLLNEVQSYPFATTKEQRTQAVKDDFAIVLEMETSKGPINLLTTTMVFGTPKDVTVSELAIECFFPQDERSAKTLRELCASG
jgi:transcriptional regulator with XRE-family HTH domain